MVVFRDKITQIDNVLNQMAEQVQLDKTRYDRMVSAYKAVQEWIESDEEFFKPYQYEVYPHGSVRILTTVKPINRDEFDLDIVIHFTNSLFKHSPLKIYQEIERRLNENETYKNMLEPKSRVLRLNYAGDFHMDIMPGVQEYDWDDDRIKVPDCDLDDWVSSNPRGYGSWFTDKANLVKISLLERAFSAESIQVDDFRKKKPLQRAVQLIKRYRDIYFQDDDTYKTRSIILTTIAGQYYEGDDSIFYTVDNIITAIYRDLGKLPTRIRVLNPVNPDEDFTDKWDEKPEYYEAFKKFIKHLYLQWQELKGEHGLLREGQVLKGLFGDKLVELVMRQETNNLTQPRKNGDLGIKRQTGIISKIITDKTIPIKKNTFFGNEKS